MRALTIRFGEALEERERERRRHSRKLAAGSIAIAALGIAYGSRDLPPAPAPEPITITETVYVDHPVLVERQGPPSPAPGELKPVVLPAPVAQHDVPLVLPSFGRRFDGVEPARMETLEPRTRHLCLTPRAIRFAGGSTVETVRISNPSAGSIVVTGVATVSDRKTSGIEIDDTACVHRWLEPGEQCAVVVRLRKRIGETVQLRVSQDVNDDVETMTIEARER